MSNPLHAGHYADSLVQRQVELVENVRLARDTYRARFRCPELADRILPGQFIMLRLANRSDPLIGRPLALYDVVPEEGRTAAFVDVVYLVKGKFTSRLVESPPGTRLDVWGPLGNGFSFHSAGHLIMTAGGIGQTPFLALAQEALGQRRYGAGRGAPSPASRVTLLYGARSAELLAGIDHFERIGVDVQIATDDGSRGHHGLVTELLDQVLAERPGDCRVVTCGPEPMLAAVARRAAQAQVPCEVSLETPMACGIGVCFTCVARVRDAHGHWDYKRTCVDGPVFAAERIEW